MSETAPSVGELFRETRRAFERNAMSIALVATGLTTLQMSLAHLLDIFVGSLAFDSDTSVTLVTGALGVVWALIVGSFARATIVHVVCSRRTQRSPTLRESATYGLSRTPAVALAASTTMAITTAATFFFVIPGIYAHARFLLAAAVATMEPGASPMARSAVITRGHAMLVLLAMTSTVLVPVTFAYGFGGWLVATMNDVRVPDGIVRLVTARDVPTVSIGILCQSVTLAMASTFEAVLYRRLTRKPRSLGKELAQVFR